MSDREQFDPVNLQDGGLGKALARATPTGKQLDCERKLAEQSLLRALLHRSGYAGVDYVSLTGRDYATEVLVIERLRHGMVMGDLQPALWANIAFNEAVALLRWEDDGGRPRGSDGIGTTGRQSA